MQKRQAQNLPIISGALRSETLIYPHREQVEQRVLREAAAVFAGVVYDDASLSDETVLDTLRSLTEAVCVPFQQGVCFYEYRNIDYIWTNQALA